MKFSLKSLDNIYCFRIDSLNMLLNAEEFGLIIYCLNYRLLFDNQECLFLRDSYL